MYKHNTVHTYKMLNRHLQIMFHLNYITINIYILFFCSKKRSKKKNKKGFVKLMSSSLFVCKYCPTLSLAVGGMAIFLVYLFKYQDRLLYIPNAMGNRQTTLNKYPYNNPGNFGLKYKEIWIKTEDNIKLHTWFIPYNNDNNDCEYLEDDTENKVCKNTPTILWFHANAGNMGHRLRDIKLMHDKLSCNIYIISYRGYGDSDGEFPTESGMKIDGITAYNYVRDTMGLNNIYVFGRSLGGAVAINTVQYIQNDAQFNGLIIENTFKSIDDMVGSVFPFLNFNIIKKYILRLEWKSIDIMKDLECPILFIASTNDEIVPHKHMLELYDICPSKSKEIIKIFGAQHNNAPNIGGSKYYNAMKQFIHE